MLFWYLAEGDITSTLFYCIKILLLRLYFKSSFLTFDFFVFVEYLYISWRAFTDPDFGPVCECTPLL